MSGVLIYTESEAERNAYAASQYKRHLGVRLVNEDYDGEADFVINRTNDYTVAERFEKRGIRVFNPSTLSRLANDKQLCYEFMQKNGIPIMPINYKGVPVIKKKIDGAGGTEVFMLNEAEVFEEGFVYQQPCDTLGKDLRVWVLGGKIVASILRESKNDFRSNFCLGGTATPYAMNDKQTALVNKVISLVEGDYMGIDFIFHNGEMVFNEIEDTVGARMIYATSDVDIIKMYCDYIKEQIKG